MRIRLTTSKVFYRLDASLPFGAEHLTFAAGAEPQVVPDWVRECNTFKHGIADGSIIEVCDEVSAAPVEDTPPWRRPEEIWLDAHKDVEQATGRQK